MLDVSYSNFPLLEINPIKIPLLAYLHNIPLDFVCNCEDLKQYTIKSN